jgi:hypothetical protein
MSSPPFGAVVRWHVVRVVKTVTCDDLGLEASFVASLLEECGDVTVAPTMSTFGRHPARTTLEGLMPTPFALTLADALCMWRGEGAPPCLPPVEGYQV